MTEEPLLATYRLRTTRDVEATAASVANESSAGTFTPVPGMTSELVERHGARVRHIVEASAAGTWERTVDVTIEFPIVNFGANLPALVTTLVGNAFELVELDGLRLIDVQIPESLRAQFPVPGFGVEGTRRLVGVDEERPLFGTIIKPSVGLSPERTAEMVGELARAGLDFVKDDELISNPPYSPVQERIVAVQEAIEAAAAVTGRRLMYAYNITDDAHRMLSHLNAIEDAGGTCAMVVVSAVGLAAVAQLRRQSNIPIHAHRGGWAAMGRSGIHGASFHALQALWRLTGIDHLHVGGVGGKFWESDRSVLTSIDDCLRPLASTADRVLPVLSSGQWAGTVHKTILETRTSDLLILAGGGILGHPGGIAAGVASMHHAYAAAKSGQPLADAAQASVALQQALEAFGPALIPR